MPSRTPRYEVRVQNDHEDRGYPCATMDECHRIARQNEGTIIIYDRKRPGLQIEWFEIYQEALPTCDACEGSGTMQAGNNEIPREVCSTKEESMGSEQFHPNMIECWDAPTHTTPEEQEHAEIEPLAHVLDCDCEACQNEAIDGMERLPDYHTCAGDAADAVHDRRLHTFKKVLAGGAIIACTLLPAHVDARDYPAIGSEAYSSGCEITNEFEDGSATAYCPEDGARYAFDADGGFIQDHGIVFFYRNPGTWYEV